MTDLLTDENLAQAFGSFRADALSRVDPPGVAEVRRTARRRRTVHYVTAGVAVLALGGAAVTLRADWSSLTPAAAAPSEAELTKLAENVVTAASGGTANVAQATDGHYSQDFDILATSYSVFLSCAGVGALAVTVISTTQPGRSPSRAHRADVPCGLPAHAVTVSTGALSADRGRLTVRIDASPQAVDRSAFAYVLQPDTDGRLGLLRTVATAMEADPYRSSYPAKALGVQTGFGVTGSAYATVTPDGDYLLEYDCVAAYGSVTITVSATTTGDPTLRKQLTTIRTSCGPNVIMSSSTLTKRTGDRLEVNVQPGPGTSSDLAYATMLVRK